MQGSELHTRGYEVCKGAIPLDASIVDAIKAANYDEKGLPSGPHPDGPRDPRRQQTLDATGTSHWIQEVRARKTAYLRERGHLKCSMGEKVVKKMHGIRSLATPRYDEENLDPQDGDQDEHADEPNDHLTAYMDGRSDEDMPFSTILAIMPGTRLRIRPFGGEWTIVRLKPGDLLIFRGDVCHNGLGYANENVRVHAYVYPPDYKPGASSINAC